MNEKELLSEKEFKDALEAKLLVLLDKGDWVASMKDSIHVLSNLRINSSYNYIESKAGLQIFLHAESIDVVTSGYIVKMNSKVLCNKVGEVYHKTNTAQKIRGQQTTQIDVIKAIDGLLAHLPKEPM